MRSSGILMPVFSLPSPYGIGCFSSYTKDFIKKIAFAGQSFWQVLPLGPTSYGDSPYQSPSSFAGNPYFVDIETLQKDGLLTKDECVDYLKICPGGNRIDYKFLYETRSGILKKAFSRFDSSDTDYKLFLQTESYWIDEFALFSAIKDRFGGVGLFGWDNKIRMRDEESIKKIREELVSETEYHKFVQYEFMKQWADIRKTANNYGIKIIGDMPIYAAYDSAECWSEPELFDLDENRTPVNVAGCPPDKFSPKGQLWGNPVYNWDSHARTGYRWWAERMKRNMRLYDVVRIDHFRGFESFYSIPYGSSTAEKGVWKKGPGAEFFAVIGQKCENVKIIAEDLGFITDNVRKMVEKTGFPGMKVLQFAFDGREDSDYLPHNYCRNSIVYTGTHDNHTSAGWFAAAPPKDVAFAKEYMNIKGGDVKTFCDAFVRLAMSSVSDVCIIPFQDYLALGDECRINVPGITGNSWKVRFCENDFTDALAVKICEITKLYGRKRNNV